MAQVFIGCSRCGQPIPVDDDTVRTSALAGTAVTVEHDVCPGGETPDEPEQPDRWFRVQVMVCEMPAPDGDLTEPDIQFPAPTCDGIPVELIAGAGTTIRGTSAGSVIAGPATSWLSHTWPQMQKHAGFADLPGTTPTTGS